jgi:predicted nucleic acid-binding protein
VILVDTSIWMDHLRAGHPILARLLQQGQVLGHAWVTGEISLGSLSQREHVLRLLSGLPQAEVATAPEVAGFIEQRQLYGLGIGYVDAALLAATALTADARLWTGDRRLATASTRLDLHTDPTGFGAPDGRN